MEKQSARCRVDDIAATFVIPRRFRFFVWVTLNERKWVTLAERRGMSERCVGEIWVIIVGKPKLVASSGEDDRLFQRARSQKAMFGFIRLSSLGPWEFLLMVALFVLIILKSGLVARTPK